mmetsp:Transcript_33259/g.49559  ORF Transcript_33259/g.49559 Transcript_33259/m.49559 type:complete len:332 (-) Transcript_33259:117-1112(-)
MVAAATATARSITRVAARAFSHPSKPGGGNPVTVFLCPSVSHLPSSVQSDLARTCEWESVVASLPSKSAKEQGQIPSFRFYLPNGDEVSFCAHAAIGAAAVVAAEDAGPSSTLSFATADGNQQDIVIRNGEAELLMEAKLDEDIPDDFLALGDIRSALGLRMEDVSLGGEVGYPSYMNSSVARPKTLFPIVDMNRLHAARNPPDAGKFRDLCDKIKSTGIYLYSACDEIGNSDGDEDDGASSVARFECRQFPRYSGYPEDPATGIAAAALAASLRKRGIGGEFYEFYQGTAMGRSSQIRIRFDRDADGEIDIRKMYCSGLVEILSKEDVEV